MTLFYGFRKKYGLYYGVAFHWSNLDEEEVYDYWSKESYEYPAEAIDDAREWASLQGYPVEREP